MQELKKIWAFGLPYLRPYKFRFFLGVALSIVFGLSNGIFVLSVNTLFNRLAPPNSALALKAPKPKPSSTDNVSALGKWKTDIGAKVAPAGRAIKQKAGELTDQWLPRIDQPATWRQLLGGFFLLPLVMGSRAMASYFSTYCLTWVSARVIRDMQMAALRKVQDLSVAYFQKFPVSDVYSRITGDTASIYFAMTNGFVDTLREPFALLAILTSMLIIDWKLTLIAVSMLPLILFPVVKSGGRLS